MNALGKIVRRSSGLTLMELLCVIAIISIIAAIYLGVIFKAFLHVKHKFGN
jgi:prepilin-type N-terminal cleavage/methylation domain-containing protein